MLKVGRHLPEEMEGKEVANSFIRRLFQEDSQPGDGSSLKNAWHP
jgi:hypothetical protein